jgi:NAD(P)H-hydrate repair Nnr-like enzyme with NAD(P)H-hydrate epimerase domain
MSLEPNVFQATGKQVKPPESQVLVVVGAGGGGGGSLTANQTWSSVIPIGTGGGGRG